MSIQTNRMHFWQLFSSRGELERASLSTITPISKKSCGTAEGRKELGCIGLLRSRKNFSLCVFASWRLCVDFFGKRRLGSVSVSRGCMQSLLSLYGTGIDSKQLVNNAPTEARFNEDKNRGEKGDPTVKIIGIDEENYGEAESENAAIESNVWCHDRFLCLRISAAAIANAQATLREFFTPTRGISRR